MRIERVIGREVLDSRGRPTVEAHVFLSNGISGRMIVPSGASTGMHEALELRDCDSDRFDGRGVLKAVEAVNNHIAPQILGLRADEQQQIDQTLIRLDGTETKNRLGANSILAVSGACAYAAAAANKLPLYAYLCPERKPLLPTPMVNMISGGLHASGTVDIQDFLVIPVGANSFRQAVEMCVRMRTQLSELLTSENGVAPRVADEGGFGPALSSNEDALRLVTRTIEASGYKPGDEVLIALDIAASHFFENESYSLKSEKRRLSVAEMIQLLANWSDEYPVISIEDGLDENDWNGWRALTNQLGEGVQVVGDDLFVTNRERLSRGINESAANAILIKMNQIGTLTETLDVLSLAKQENFQTIVSARSGETEDTTIADLAVATRAGQIKIGSVATSERNAKYNQLMRIEDELGSNAEFAGRTPFKKFITKNLWGEY